jgi:hypothetical protein
MKQRQRKCKRKSPLSIAQRQRTLRRFCQRQLKQSISFSLEYVKLGLDQNVLRDTNGLPNVSRPCSSAHCKSRAPKAGKDDRTYALIAIKESLADLLLAKRVIVEVRSGFLIIVGPGRCCKRLEKVSLVNRS